MKLTNTTVFRLALGFAGIFVLIFTVAISLVYLITFDEIEDQTDLELSREMENLEYYHQTQSSAQFNNLVNAREKYGENLGHYYILLDEQKKYLAGHRDLAPDLVDLFIHTQEIHFLQQEAQYSDIHSILRVAYKQLSDQKYLIIAQENGSLFELREHTLTAIILAVIVTLILGLLIGIYMGRLVLQRIEDISNGMDLSIASDFKQMIEVPKVADEFQALTLKLNNMLGRIENLLTGMRQVTDNIAHDLRSPLSRMRSRLEVSLLQDRSDKEYQESMEQTISDCDNLIQTFNSLLSIAQIEAGVRGDNWQKININRLVGQLTELYQAVSEDKGQKFEVSTSGNLNIMGNDSLLIQAVSNLIENAIKYTTDNGKIGVTVSQQNEHIIVSITDNGIGIPEKDREKVLERFLRLDSARSSTGNGLGLSLVAAVAKLHNAKLQLSDNQPGLKIELIFQPTI